MKWAGFCGCLSLVFVGLSVSRSLELGAQLTCEPACPCDAPLREDARLETDACAQPGAGCEDGSCEQFASALSPAESYAHSTPIAAAFLEGQETGSASSPCPSDCADCHCYAGQAFVGLTCFPLWASVDPVRAFLPEWGSGSAKGAGANIFHPPRRLMDSFSV